jgi:AraC-like DNA-binding protein
VKDRSPASDDTPRQLSHVADRASSFEALAQAASTLEAMSRTLGAVEARHSCIPMLDAALGFIEARLFDPELAPHDVARALGVSRATLYRLFEPLGGVSAQMKQRRLMRAWSLLSSTARPTSIAVVASQVGFRSDTYFSREFRRLFGISPHALQMMRRADQN